MNYVAAIPTLIRYDLLDRLLLQLEQQTIPPQEVFVIDNGREWFPSKDYVFPLNRLHPPYNYGVAKSWNVSGRLYRPTTLLICNDDISFPSNDAVEKALAVRSPIIWLHGASCFVMRESAWRAIGEFEEGLWPANSEDTEVTIRLVRASLKIHDAMRTANNDGGTVGRVWAGTEVWCQRQIEFVRSKWDSLDANRGFREPWNGCPISPLEWEYRYRCQTPSDINEHLPTLRKYAQQCQTVVEFGVRSAVSTIALLAAQTQTLLLYDVERRPEADIVFHLRGRTNVRFKIMDSRQADFAEADMLHIDTDHTYDCLKAELFAHGNKVRKFIAMHDTQVYGQNGNDGGKGLQLAIDEFIAANPHWKIAEFNPNNHGMTVLART